jgi:cytoskeletal protein RodZ
MTSRACVWVTVFVMLGFAIAAGAADVYVWVDANGVEHWSDRPPQPSRVGPEAVKVVSPSFRNSSAPEVPWRQESDPPEPPPTRTQQAGKDQPVNDTADSTKQDTAAEDTGQTPADNTADASPPRTREEQLAEAREKREASMRRRVTGEPPPKPDAPKQAEPEVPKPANLETNSSGYSATWGL